MATPLSDSLAPRLLAMAALLVIATVAGCPKKDEEPLPPAKPVVSLGAPSSPQTNTVALNYTLSHADAESCSIAVSFSTDGGNVFTTAPEKTGLPSQGTSGLLTSPAGVGYVFVWNAAASLPLGSHADVRIRIVATDTDSDASDPVTVGPFVVNRVPAAAVTTPGGIELGDVTISYSLTDPSSGNGSIVAEYSADGGTTFTVATAGTGGDPLTPLSTAPAGATHTFVWDSFADGVATAAVNTTVRFRITPRNLVSNSGTPAVTADFTVSNIPTVLFEVPPVTPPGEQSGDVTLSYALVDPLSGSFTLTAEVAADGVSFVAATPGTGGDGLVALAATPEPGTAHTFVWDSTQLGAVDLTTVRFRLTFSPPSAGTAGTSDAFHVDNNSPPSAAVSPIVTASGFVTVSYVLTDSEGDTCSIVAEFSTDGSTFFPATRFTGAGDGTTGLVPGAHAFSWNSFADVGLIDDASVTVRITASDADAGAPGSTTFALVNDRTLAHVASAPHRRNVYTFGGVAAGGAASALAQRWSTATSSFDDAGVTDLSAARYGATAVERHGKIYVIGGTTDGTDALTTVDVYDIAGDSWSAGPALPSGRRFAGAALLRGKIVVCGGEDAAGTPLASVATLDVVAGTWSASASMSAARTRLAVTVAEDFLYAMGGANATSPGLATCERFDAFADSWSAMPDAPSGRRDHRLVALSGRVVAVGGVTNGAHASTVLHALQPWGTPAWVTLTAALASERLGNAAEEVTDRIVVLHGDPATAAAGPVLIDPFSVLDDTWAEVTPMPATLGSGSVTLADRYAAFGGSLGGRLYVVGGITGGSPASLKNDVLSYDPATDAWTVEAETLPAYRRGGSSVVHNGKLYLIGGGVGSTTTPTATCLVYDPFAGTFTPIASMSTARIRPGVVVQDGILYVIGGRTEYTTAPVPPDFTDITSVESYNFDTDTWTTEAWSVDVTPAGVSGISAVSYDGLLYVWGGQHSSTGIISKETRSIDPTAGSPSWTTRADSALHGVGAGLVRIKLKMYGIAGFDADDALQVYDFAGNTWTAFTPIDPSTVEKLRVDFVYGIVQGKLVVAGGFAFGAGTFSTVHVYTPFGE